MGGKDRGPYLHLACKPERQRHTSRETHDLHDRERQRDRDRDRDRERERERERERR